MGRSPVSQAAWGIWLPSVWSPCTAAGPFHGSQRSLPPQEGCSQQPLGSLQVMQQPVVLACRWFCVALPPQASEHDHVWRRAFKEVITVDYGCQGGSDPNRPGSMQGQVVARTQGDTHRTGPLSTGREVASEGKETALRGTSPADNLTLDIQAPEREELMPVLSAPSSGGPQVPHSPACPSCSPSPAPAGLQLLEGVPAPTDYGHPSLCMISGCGLGRDGGRSVRSDCAGRNALSWGGEGCFLSAEGGLNSMVRTTQFLLLH